MAPSPFPPRPPSPSPRGWFWPAAAGGRRRPRRVPARARPGRSFRPCLRSNLGFPVAAAALPPLGGAGAAAGIRTRARWQSRPHSAGRRRKVSFEAAGRRQLAAMRRRERPRSAAVKRSPSLGGALPRPLCSPFARFEFWSFRSYRIFEVSWFFVLRSVFLLVLARPFLHLLSNSQPIQAQGRAVSAPFARLLHSQLSAISVIVALCRCVAFLRRGALSRWALWAGRPRPNRPPRACAWLVAGRLLRLVGLIVSFAAALTPRLWARGKLRAVSGGVPRPALPRGRGPRPFPRCPRPAAV